MSLRQFYAIAIDILSGLVYVHSKNLVHRDIKTANSTNSTSAVLTPSTEKARRNVGFGGLWILGRRKPRNIEVLVQSAGDT